MTTAWRTLSCGAHRSLEGNARRTSCVGRLNCWRCTRRWPVSKKKRSKRRAKPDTVEVSVEQYAALLAKGGMATLATLLQFETAVRADPERWAAPFGATQDEMLGSIAALRAAVLVDTLNTSVTAATGV